MYSTRSANIKKIRIIKLILRETGNKHSEDKIYDASLNTKQARSKPEPVTWQ